MVHLNKGDIVVCGIGTMTVTCKVHHEKPRSHQEKTEILGSFKNFLFDDTDKTMIKKDGKKVVIEMTIAKERTCLDLEQEKDTLNCVSI